MFEQFNSVTELNINQKCINQKLNLNKRDL